MTYKANEVLPPIKTRFLIFSEFFEPEEIARTCTRTLQKREDSLSKGDPLRNTTITSKPIIDKSSLKVLGNFG